MGCALIKSNDGQTTAILHFGKGVRRSPCVSCGAYNEYECDFPASNKSGTCDAKLCARCSLHLGGRWLAIGQEFQKLDSYDFCKLHQPFVFVYDTRLIYAVNSRELESSLFSDASTGELIDRTTPLGNPFKLDGNATPAKRADVIRRFRAYLWEEMHTPDSAISRELARLQAIWLERKILTLRCWCTPKSCHGQVIAKALIWLEGQRPPTA